MASKVLLRGGCVLTLGVRTPNFALADVLIDDGVVAEVGPGIRARDAEQIDATDTIVMPGFVDTHRHAWTSLFRNRGAGEAGDEAMEGLAEHYTPEDAYAATLIGLLGAAEAGITTVVDRSPFPPDDRRSDAALQAHADSGLRTVFVAPVGAHPRTGPDAGSAGASTSIAVGSAVPGPDDLERVAGEWTRARDQGRRIHAHAGAEEPGTGAIAAAAHRGLLGDDVTLVHLSQLDASDVDAIASSGAGVSLASSSERELGRGSPPIQMLVDRDIRPGLGVEDDRSMPGDLFAQMRATISLQHARVFDLKLSGKAGVPRLMSTRDVIRYATIDGARSVGLDRTVGSLEVGMQADVIVLRTDRPNVFPINDPIGAVVWGMDTSNVDRVFVAGRCVMRDGVVDADLPGARRLAGEARERVAAAAGLVGATPGVAG